MMTGLKRNELLRVCYGKYGCFSLDHPWISARRVVNLAPKSPDFIWPNFLLYTRAAGGRRRPREDLLMEGDLERLRRSPFDPNK